MSQDMPITFPLSPLAARTEFNAYVQSLACTYFKKKNQSVIVSSSVQLQGMGIEKVNSLGQQIECNGGRQR